MKDVSVEKAGSITGVLDEKNYQKTGSRKTTTGTLPYFFFVFFPQKIEFKVHFRFVGKFFLVTT